MILKHEPQDPELPDRAPFFQLTKLLRIKFD
jgi:hypothetical protein